VSIAEDLAIGRSNYGGGISHSKKGVEVFNRYCRDQKSITSPQ
jgi:hypothetical protein